MVWSFIVKKYVFGVLILTLLLCSCLNINDIFQGKDDEQKEKSEFDDTDTGKIESFWALDMQTQSFYQISAVLLAENADCLIYAESNAQGKTVVKTSVAEGIAREYSQNIYAKMTNTFGSITHITEKNKVTFLLLDIRDGYDPAEEGGYVAGYFYPDDMEDRANSNRRDMLYIDINPGLMKMEMEALYSTMAHELQHLINYSNTVLAKGREQDLWINEGLSTAAEYVYGGDPANRVINYNEDWLNTIRLGNNFFVWNGYWELVSPIDLWADYATVYLFFQWLRLHADNDTGIYKEIINSPYFDYRAVTQTARNRIPALGLTGSPESDWEKTLRTWMLANAIQGETGLLGYRDKIGEITRNKTTKLKTYYFYETDGQPREFSPGEGIFTQIVSSPYTPPAGSGSHIRYLGFTKAGAFDITPPYEGEYLLTFNANADNKVLVYLPNDKMALLPGETGYLASSVGAAPKKEIFGGTAAFSRTAAETSARPASYPVDAGFLIKKRQWEKSRAAAAAGVNPPGE
jgi:uncharacterized protein YjaZ